MAEITIKLPKMLLILNENELIQALTASPEVLRKAIGKGKRYKRAMSTQERLAEGFDRWKLYEVLKSNRLIDKCTYDWIKGMNHTELVEGVIAYLERLKHM